MMSIAFEQAGSTSAKPTITSRAMISLHAMRSGKAALPLGLNARRWDRRPPCSIRCHSEEREQISDLCGEGRLFATDGGVGRRSRGCCIPG